MKKRSYLFLMVCFLMIIITFRTKAQNIPGKSFLFSNTLATDSTMLMASWWNFNANSVTYETWIKPIESDLSFDGYRTRTLIYKQHYGTSGIYLANNPDGTSCIKVVIPGISAPWTVKKLPMIKDNEWSYVALVVNGSNNKVTVWVNEQKYDSVFSAPIGAVNFWAGHMPGGDGNLKQVRPVTMGVQWPYYPGRTTMMPQGRASVDRFFRGEMDEVRIWNIARSDEQIISNRYKPLTGKEDGLLAYYDFESISQKEDSLFNCKTGKLDCQIWGKNQKSGLTKSYAMVRPTIKNPIGLTENGFNVQWNSIANIDSYYLDVARDSLFLEILDKYMNKKIAKDQTSFQVDVANISQYFVRLRVGDEDGNSYSAYSPKVSVIVSGNPVSSITLTTEKGLTSITDDRGKLNIIATVLPDGLTNKAVVWSVDNTKLATINQQGTLMANANGKVIVTATSLTTPSMSASISIDLKNQAPDVWITPSVKHPAPLYWCGYLNMNQLVDPNASWDFVKQNMDGFLFHGAYWANVSGFPEVPAVATKLAAILKPLNKKNLMELGWPGTYTQFQPTADMALKKAQGHVSSLDKMKLWGINIDEINIDLHMYLFKPLCIKHPDWSVKDISAWITGDFNNYDGPATIYKPGYFPDYVNTIRKTYPSMTFYAVDSPVWFWWDNYPSLGKSENNQRFDPLTGFDPITGANNTTPVLVNGQPVKFLFNWHDIMQGVINSSGNNGFEGLGSDYPYDYTQWSEPVARESCYNKVLTYEKWFQSVGKKHTLICNTSDGDKLYPGNKDSWDKNYYEKSMATLINYQKRGGRADRYLFESWYSGPYTIVPETKKYSFTNLVKDAINYLKGIDQNLDLQIRRESDQVYAGINLFQGRPDGVQNIVVGKNTTTQIFRIKLRNAGDVNCYPMIKALKMNQDGWKISFFDQDTNITTRIFSDEGYTFSNLFEPGMSGDIKVVIESSAIITGNLELSIWAFWNPQDPTNTIRDVVAIRFDQSMGVKQNESNSKFTCYPNPVSGMLTIDLHSRSKKLSVKITSLPGKIEYINEFNNVSSVQINTNELNVHGIHLLEIVADGIKYVDKLLIK